MDEGRAQVGTAWTRRTENESAGPRRYDAPDRSTFAGRPCEAPPPKSHPEERGHLVAGDRLFQKDADLRKRSKWLRLKSPVSGPPCRAFGCVRLRASRALGNAAPLQFSGSSAALLGVFLYSLPVPGRRGLLPLRRGPRRAMEALISISLLDDEGSWAKDPLQKASDPPVR